MPNKFGLYDLEEVNQLGLPIYDYTIDDEPGMSVDLWTYTDIKEVFNWKMNDDLRKNMIRGFVKRGRMQGYAPVYSLREVMYIFVGWSYYYEAPSDN